jgi:hypothetical protein
MAYQSKENIKSKFEKGDLPSQEDFENLIDSCYNAVEGYSGTVQFIDNNSVTNSVSISAGLIVNWTQSNI